MSALQVNNSNNNVGCCVSVIRSKVCFSVTKGAHLVGLAAGVTALVSGYYFASIDQSAYNQVSYGLGASGVMMLGYNITGLSYLLDYKKLLKEASKISELQEVILHLQKETENMNKIEDELEEEEEELKEDVEVFEGQVKKFSDQINELKLELENSKKLEDGFNEISKQMQEERKALEKEVKSMHQVAVEVEEDGKKRKEEQKRLLSAIAVVEQKIDAIEEFMIKNLQSQTDT